MTPRYVCYAGYSGQAVDRKSFDTPATQATQDRQWTKEPNLPLILKSELDVQQ